MIISISVRISIIISLWHINIFCIYRHTVIRHTSTMTITITVISVTIGIAILQYKYDVYILPVVIILLLLYYICIEYYSQCYKVSLSLYYRYILTRDYSYYAQ